MRHPIKKIHAGVKPVVAKHDQTSAPRWPSYTGLSQVVGTSPSGRVTVYVDPSLGNPALQNAQDLLNDADRVVAANDTIFGTTGGATDGTGGADHMGCDYETGAACARLLSRRQRPSRQLRWQTVARSGPGA
jgi:hypothetical protein